MNDNMTTQTPDQTTVQTPAAAEGAQPAIAPTPEEMCADLRALLVRVADAAAKPPAAN